GPPVMARLLHAFGAGVRGDLVAVVVDAVGHHRPTVVAAGADDVELVAATRSVLGGPDAPGVRIQGQALGVAMADAVDRGQRALHGEGVAGRRAVSAHAVHLARGVGRGAGAPPGAAAAARGAQ